MRLGKLASRAMLAGLLLGAPAAAPRAETGIVGADFLRVMLSPRAVGMGEAGAGLADDHLSALSVNPAGLARLDYPEMSFLYNQWFEGLTFQNIAYAHPVKKIGTFALSGTLLNSEDIPGFDNTGARVEDVKARDISFRGAFARRIAGPEDPRFGLFGGVGMRYVREELETASASTVLYDAGFLYRTKIRNSAFGLGASMESLGNGLQFDQQRDPAPTQARAGVSWVVPLLRDPLTLVADVRKPRESGASFGFGGEYIARRLLAWRIGFTSDRDLGAGMRFGVGFKLKIFNLDYALAHFGDFGFTHRVAIAVKFGGNVAATLPVRNDDQEAALRHIERGDAMMSETRYYEAALEYNEALKLDPHNRTALEKLRLVRELMSR